MPQFTPPQDAMGPLIQSLIQDKLRQQQFERAQNARIQQEQRTAEIKAGTEQEKREWALAVEALKTGLVDPRNLRNPDGGINLLAAANAIQQSARVGAESEVRENLQPLADVGAALPAFRSQAADSPETARLRQSFGSGIVARGIQNQPRMLSQLAEQMGQGVAERREAGEKANIAELKMRDREVMDAGSKILSSAIIEEDQAAVGRVRSFYVERWEKSKGLDRFAASQLKAESIAIEEARKALTAEGRSETAMRAEAQRYLNPGISVADSKALALPDMAIIDAFSSRVMGRPIVIPTQGMKSYKLQASRQALVLLADELGMAEQSFARLEAAPDKVGPMLGLPQFQEALRAFGEENAEAVIYSSYRNQLVATMLKAQQGSRPSDYDLRFYMMLMPSLTEVGAGSAASRFSAMRDILNLQAEAQVNPDLRRKLEKMRSKPWAEADFALKAAAERYTERVRQLGPDDHIARLTAERAYDAEVLRWRKKRGNKFTLEANDLLDVSSPVPAPSDPAMDAFRDSGGFRVE